MKKRPGYRVRYAVVGLGNIAQVAVLPAFEHARENSELVALISSDREKLRTLSARYDVQMTGGYDDLEQIVGDRSIDAVYVAVPNSLHRSITERAARAGAHVLCEKPLALTEEDAEAMIRVTQQNHVKLMVAYRLHFDEANLDAVERIRAGEIGDPRIFSSIFSHQVREGDARTRADLGGGSLFDLGIYCINAARYLFQAEPLEVFAEVVQGTSERFRDVDEMVTAVLRFPGNRLAQFTCSQGAALVSEFRVIGTSGDIRLDPAYNYSDPLQEFITVDGTTKKKVFGARDQFAPELVYFSKCILEGLDPIPSGEEGLADIRILCALQRAAETGRRVKLRPSGRRRRPSAALMMKKPPVKRVKTVNAPSPTRAIG